MKPDSPHKWRKVGAHVRWHITLSRFLADYLYIPLGGNRRGEPRRMVNIMVTMLLGGLWHGANWTFVVWGGLHGLFIIINHLVRKAFPGRTFTSVGFVLTFLCVAVAWVFFRADSVERAFEILAAMAGAGGLIDLGARWSLFLNFVWVGGAMSIAFLASNTGEIFSDDRDEWVPSLRWGVAIGVFAAICLLSLSSPTEFLYFNF